MFVTTRLRRSPHLGDQAGSGQTRAYYECAVENYCASRTFSVGNTLPSTVDGKRSGPSRAQRGHGRPTLWYGMTYSVAVGVW
jgi:hypothetical protein